MDFDLDTMLSKSIDPKDQPLFASFLPSMITTFLLVKDSSLEKRTLSIMMRLYN